MSLKCADNSGSGVEFSDPNATVTGTGRPWTIIIGFNAPDNAAGSDFSAILQIHDAGGDPFTTVQMKQSGLVRSFYRPGGGGQPSASCDSPIGQDDGAWHSTMFVEYAANDHRSYLDFANESQDTTNITNTVTPDVVRVSNPPGGNVQQGRMFARLMMFKRALTVDEAKAAFERLDFRNGRPDFWCEFDQKNTQFSFDRIRGSYGTVTDMLVDAQPTPPFMWPIPLRAPVYRFVPAAGQEHTGSGALAAAAATVAGTGEREVTGTGALAAAAASIAGTGLREITGSGELLLDPAVIAGVGEREITGTGALQSDVVTGTGTGAREITGTGVLSLDAATITGTGERAVTGTGILSADSANITGTGARIIDGTGALVAGDATVVGIALIRHARQQIRAAVKTVLTGLTTTGSNVTASRVSPVDAAALPHLSIYTPEDELDEDNSVMGSKEFRLLTLRIEGRVKKTSGYADQLNTIAAEVRAALAADKTLGVGVKRLTCISSEIQTDDAAEKPTGLLTMTWLVLYRVDRTDPAIIVQ